MSCAGQEHEMTKRHYGRGFEGGEEGLEEDCLL
jgi:hypothetical protein